MREARQSKPLKKDEVDEEDDDDDLLLKGMAKSHLDRHLELDQDVDPITRLSMLNDDQRRVYEKISSHYCTNYTTKTGPVNVQTAHVR